MLKCNEALIFTLFDLYRLQDQELSPKTVLQLRKALLQYFKTSSFVTENTGNNPNEHVSSAMVLNSDMDSHTLNLFVIPFKKKEENPRNQHESYISAVQKLQDQVALSLSLRTLK
jgi:protein SMG9